jgi:hypothetical protein
MLRKSTEGDREATESTPHGILIALVISMIISTIAVVVSTR